jgi:hypothetical protein
MPEDALPEAALRHRVALSYHLNKRKTALVAMNSRLSSCRKSRIQSSLRAQAKQSRLLRGPGLLRLARNDELGL